MVAAAASGLVAAAAGLGAGEAAAAAVRPEASPIVVVANRFILATPEWLKQLAIRNFGTDDKLALKLGIYLAIAGLAAVIGWRAAHRLAEGLIGLGLFAAIGVFCALTTHAHKVSDVIPVIVAALVAALVLTVLVDALTGANHFRREPAEAGEGTDRRRFLVGGAAGAGLAAAAGFGGRAVQHQRFDAARSRAKVVLPPATGTSAVLPAGADLGRSPAPFQTPNGGFYRIDTAFVTPQLTADSWRLKIHGMVDNPFELTFADLLATPLVERWVTLTCVSNEVGGDLVGNALWRGVLLAPLLRRAGVQAGADQLVSRSVDGMTIGTPVATVMDGRDAMLALGMNGQPLPVAHGFPVRMLVPGLYGYVSACKWITEIEVTTFERYDAYWVQRGWLARCPIELSSRIDTPSGNKRVKVGETVVIAGVAWHQHVGIGRVEVRVDDGPWAEARLGAVPSTDTWRQWTTPWTVSGTGRHRITVRAFDTAGAAQDTSEHEPLPGASSGLHRIAVYAS